MEENVSIIVQVNGKLRDTVTVESSKLKVQSEVEEAVKASEKIQKFLEGRKLKK